MRQSKGTAHLSFCKEALQSLQELKEKCHFQTKLDLKVATGHEVQY